MCPVGTFTEMVLPANPTTRAPDGSDVRALLAMHAGSMAHFALAPGSISAAVRHRSVDEIWYVIAGRGDMWRQDDAAERVVALRAGCCLTIPAGTSFQFRSSGPESLTVVAITMPPWPVAGDAELVTGNPDW